MEINKKIGFRTWKSGKKWLVSSTIVVTVVFGPNNLIGAAATLSPSSSSTDLTSQTVASTSSSNTSLTSQSTPSISSSSKIQAKSTSLQATTLASNLTLDMNNTTPTNDNSVSYNLTSDGVGWPSSSSNTKQLTVSGTFSAGDIINITLPKGITVATYDNVSGMTASKTTTNGSTTITYTVSSGSVSSMNISYYFTDQGSNNQFAPGITTLPVTVTSGSTTINGSIVVTNPITTTAVSRIHNTAVTNNTFTADGSSIYNFVMGINTTPSFTNFSAGITQPQHALMSGTIHVPAGFVLTGASLANYQDTNYNSPSDGSATPGIPSGISQPGGAGTDIIVSNVVGGGYNVYNESFMYLYGYFASGTPAGTYHFSTDLTLTPQYYSGTVGSIPVSAGTYSNVIIGNANSGSMQASYSGVLEGNNSSVIDTNHEGFYSNSISSATGVTGFVTGKSTDTSINRLEAMPTIAVNFLDTTVNQTNVLKDYKLTLPKNWRGNLTDVSFSTGPNGTVTTTENENSNGPYNITLDNGATYTVSTLTSNDSTITNALASGAHILTISGQAKILAGNNLTAKLKNAVIDNGTYNNGDLVPIQLDVHSVTSNTDIQAIGHLKYFDNDVTSSTQFSIKNDLNYNISGTYTQGQTFTTGAQWTLLNSETSLNGDSTGKIIIPGNAASGTTANVVLPTFIVSSVDKGMIDLDTSKISSWGWTYKGVKYYPVITDLGIDPTTGEHLTKLDFSKYAVTVSANVNPAQAFMYPDPLPWKVNDIAAPASGTTTHWITQLTDNNKDSLHPVYGGLVYNGSTGMNWKITASAQISSKVGLSGTVTGINNYYIDSTGVAGFNRGVKSDTTDDSNNGNVMLSITNGSSNNYFNPEEVVSLPNTDNGDSFTLSLTGPVTNIQGTGTKVLYSTKSSKLPASNSDTSIDLTTSDWVDASQVTDWSTIRSVAITANTLNSQSIVSGYVPVQINNINSETIGETATVQSYIYAKGLALGSDLSIGTKMTAQIYGIPQLLVHYEETVDGLTSDNKKLADSDTITEGVTNGMSPAYTNYNTAPKTISGYTYKGLSTTSSPSQGTLTDSTTDVTYLYTQDQQKVLVHYINVSTSDKTSGWVPNDGSEITSSLQTLTGGTNDSYTNTLSVPQGYDLVGADVGATNGTFDNITPSNQNEYVYIKAQNQKVIYNVIDDTSSNTLQKDILFDEGGTDTNLIKTQTDLQNIINGYTNKGYTLKSSDDVPTNFDNNSAVDQVINIHLVHTLVSVTPSNPGTPGSPINPNNPDGPKWPEGTDKASLSKIITRTINYLDKQTNKVIAKSVVQTVEYDRTAIVDKVTGELLGYDTNADGKVDVTVTDAALAWSTSDNLWQEVTSPDLTSKGYEKPSIGGVAKENVTVDSPDKNIDVFYDHTLVSVTPNNPETPGISINPNVPNNPDKAIKPETNKTIEKDLAKVASYKQLPKILPKTGESLKYATITTALGIMFVSLGLLISIRKNRKNKK